MAADRNAFGSRAANVRDAFARAAGAPLIGGNKIRLLKDAAENYPAWLTAIESARLEVCFESYFIEEDEVGRRFRAALAARAREGVRVRVLYDWMGAVGRTPCSFWQPLREAGAEVRCFNPPRFSEPFGWLGRDHRKMVAVDGEIGFVTGLCVGQSWVGRPEKKIEPWRDTGVEIRGPAVAEIVAAFTQTWAAARREDVSNNSLGATEGSFTAALPRREDLPPAGDTAVRIIASRPGTTGIYLLDQLIAARVSKSLWLTDAYFLGTTPYIQALRAAALDGVDVRLLVPGASDLALVSSLSRAIYRPLLEAGVRVFEWNGPMLHAKTAVADEDRSRVGSSNLNLASWFGNWELDVAIEDREFARAMRAMYEEDLEHSTEVILSARRKRVRLSHSPEPRPRRARGKRGSASRAAAGAFGVASAVGALVTHRRLLGPAEAKIMVTAATTFFLLAIVLVWAPRALTVPLAAFGFWVAGALLWKAWRLHCVAAPSATARSGQAAKWRLFF